MIRPRQLVAKAGNVLIHSTQNAPLVIASGVFLWHGVNVLTQGDVRDGKPIYRRRGAEQGSEMSDFDRTHDALGQPVVPTKVPAPDRIRVAQDSDGFWTCREAVSGSQEYVRADIADNLVAALVAAKREMWLAARSAWTLSDFSNWAVIQQINAALTRSDGLDRPGGSHAKE